MDDTNALENKLTPAKIVQIDSRALDAIRDIASQMLPYQPIFNRHKLMFESLAAYIKRNGGEPGFEVKLWL